LRLGQRVHLPDAFVFICSVRVRGRWGAEWHVSGAGQYYYGFYLYFRREAFLFALLLDINVNILFSGGLAPRQASWCGGCRWRGPAASPRGDVRSIVTLINSSLRTHGEKRVDASNSIETIFFKGNKSTKLLLRLMCSLTTQLIPLLSDYYCSETHVSSPADVFNKWNHVTMNTDLRGELRGQKLLIYKYYI